MAQIREQFDDTIGQLETRSEGTIPLRTRADLQESRIGFGGRLSYVIKDPIGLKYHRLQPVQKQLLELLREPRTLEQLQLELNLFEPSSQFEIRDVQQMLTDFHEKGLLISSRPGQGHELYKIRLKEFRQEVLQVLKGLLFMRLPGWSPTRVLNWLEPIRQLILHPLTIIGCCLIILGSLLLVGREYAEFQRRLPDFQQFFAFRNLPYMWLSIIVAKIVHEFGHALVCRHFGAEPHQIGVMLLIFTPTMYCDVTDSWMLKSKWQRMAIGFGGPFFEAVLASIALFVWWWTVPGTLHFVCLNLFMLSAITNVIFNLNPLIRFDGYYILSDYLEIPNLKQQSDRAMQAAFCRYGLGVELPRDPLLPETGNRWLLVYGLAAWLYRWLIMFGITMFLYTMFKPWGLERFAFVLLIFTLGMMIYGMGKAMHQALKQIRPVRPAWTRYLLLGMIGSGVVALLTLVPIPYWITCSFELEPEQARHLHTMTPGFLQQILVEPGQTVVAGQPLLRLHNPDLEQEQLELEMEQDKLKTQLMVARLQREDQQIAAVQDQLTSIAARLQNLQEQRTRLVLYAPVTGKVFPAEKRPGELADRRKRLPHWQGSVFDAENHQAWLDKATPVLTVAPNDRLQAILLIDQADRNDITVGQKVLLQCEPWSGAYLESEIQQIAERETRQAPRALSEKAGGVVTTVTTNDGREEMLSAAYRGVVNLPENQLISTSLMGTTGSARVIISHRTVAGWGWRLACQTFRFRL